MTQIKISKLFGITDKQEQKTRMEFDKQKESTESTTQLTKLIKLKKGIDSYNSYLFGRHIQQNEQIANNLAMLQSLQFSIHPDTKKKIIK